MNFGHICRVLVELAQLQDDEVGDGTTSVVILAAELLKVRTFFTQINFNIRLFFYTQNVRVSVICLERR